MASVRAAESSERHAARVAVRALLVVVGVLVVAIGALLLTQGGTIAQHVKDRALPKVSQALGRDVTVDRADADLLPYPTVQLTGVRVAGGEGEPELVTASTAKVSVELWPLITSLGKDIRVRAVELREPVVNLVKRADGSWSYSDLGQGSTGDAATEDAQPAGPLPHFKIAQLALTDGTLRIIDRSLPGKSDAQSTVALTHLDLKANDIEPGRPLELGIDAALLAADRNLHGKLVVENLPTDFSTLTPETYPAVHGNLKLDGAHIAAVEGFLPADLASLITSGTVTLTADLSTQDHTYVASGKVKLDKVSLRNQPADGSLAFTGRWNPAHPDAIALDVRDLALSGPGIDAKGTASLKTAPTRVEFDLSGQKLDLDSVLALAPEAEKPAKGAAAAAGPAELVPEATRKQLAGVAMRGHLAFGQVVSGKLAARDLDATATLKDGVLTLEQGAAKLYDGQVNLDGTTADLREAKPRWKLSARMQGVNLGGAMASLSGQDPLAGKLDGTLDLTGAGNDWSALVEAVTGAGAIALEDGALKTTDLGQKLSEGIAAGLTQLGKSKLAQTAKTAGGGTAFKDLAASFKVKDGWMTLQKPLAFRSDLGDGTLSGRIGLDKRLDLQGSIAVSPGLVKQVTRGQLAPKSPVNLPLAIRGTLLKPEVTVNPSKDLAKQLITGSPVAQKARREANKQVDRAKDEVKRQVQGRLKGFLKR